MSEQTKVCSKCGLEKTLDCFPPRKKGKHGRHSQCRLCENARRRHWCANNKEAVMAYEKKAQIKNPERAINKWRTFRNKNGESYLDLPHVIAKVLGIKTSDLTTELLELKREQLRLYRLTKQLKQELTNV